MGTAKLIACALIAAIPITACDKSIDDEVAALERYAKAHPVGASPEVWLELHVSAFSGSFSSWP